MTREEAIAILNHNVSACLHGTEWGEALDIAIEALEHPEKNVVAVVPCGDTISRQAVKDMLMREWTRYIPMDLDVNLSFVLAKVDELPLITPQYTEVEIQKMQELEQAEIQKAYELGKAEMQPCDDCISRQEVEKITWEEASYTDALNVLTEVREKVRALPPVTPQPKTGQWVDDKCSVCGKGIEDLIESSEWYWNESPKYCPFCGIKIQPYKAESEDKE